MSERVTLYTLRPYGCKEWRSVQDWEEVLEIMEDFGDHVLFEVYICRCSSEQAHKALAIQLRLANDRPR